MFPQQGQHGAAHLPPLASTTSPAVPSTFASPRPAPAAPPLHRSPYAAIYAVWQTGTVAKEAEVPTWILVVGGAGIVLGLATYGYKVRACSTLRSTLHTGPGAGGAVSSLQCTVAS